MRIAFSALFTLLSACASQHDVGCPTIAYAGLSVVVTDSKTGARICDATVTAADGAYGEKLLAMGPGTACGYAGAYERPGTYTLHVEHAGYKPGTSSPTVVGRTTGDCPHVEQKSVSLALDPI
jgi:hypothetical protein